MAKIQDYRIVTAEKPTRNERRAAAFLRRNIRIVTGKTLPMVTDKSAPEELEIVVGKTSREEMDQMNFQRDPKTAWSFVARFHGQRLYLSGMGVAAEPEAIYKAVYGVPDDGAFGTNIAAYRFVEDVLGFEFLYDGYLDYPETPELEMPLDWEVDYTRDTLMQEKAPLLEGPAFWSVPSARVHNWNMGCMIFRSKEGRIAVIDGGLGGDMPHLLSILREITGQEKPVVHAWLFTHLHEDHYGAFCRICRQEEWHDKIEIRDFYCHLLPDEYYLSLSKEAKPEFADVLNCFHTAPEVLGLTMHTVEEGDVIELDDLSFKVLHVPDLSVPTMNMNNSSVIYRLDHESGQRFLLLGDGEWVVDHALKELPPEELKSDVVQVGHHGVGNVSDQVYDLMDAKVFIYQACPRFWYSDRGEGLGSHQIGMDRLRRYLLDCGAKRENIYPNHKGIVALPLPIPVK